MSLKYRRELNRAVAGGGFAVEIGVAEGNFSLDILNWGKFDRLYLVDRWETTPTQKGDASSPQSWHDDNLLQVKAKIFPYRSSVVLLQGSSVAMSREVEDGSISFLYIDADHSYCGVMADLNAWYPKVRKGGLIAFHDYENPAYGVKKAVEEFCRHRSRKIHLLPEDKPEDAGAFFYK